MKKTDCLALTTRWLSFSRVVSPLVIGLQSLISCSWGHSYFDFPPLAVKRQWPIAEDVLIAQFTADLRGRTRKLSPVLNRYRSATRSLGDFTQPFPTKPLFKRVKEERLEQTNCINLYIAFDD